MKVQTTDNGKYVWVCEDNSEIRHTTHTDGSETEWCSSSLLLVSAAVGTQEQQLAFAEQVCEAMNSCGATFPL